MITASYEWQQLALPVGGNPQVPFVVVLRIEGYARVFTNFQSASFPSNYYPWIQKDGQGTLRQASTAKDGGCNAYSAEVVVLDGDIAHPQAISDDYTNDQVFDGKKATLLVGFPSIPLSEYLTLATMVVDRVDYDKELTCYKFVLRDQSVLLNNYTFTTAGNGLPTTRTNPYSVIDTPANLITAALTGAGLPSGNINTAALDQVAADYWYSLKMKFDITYPPEAKSWVNGEIMKVLGGYWYWNNLGQWTPFIMLPLSPQSSVLTLDETNISVDSLPVPQESQDYTSSLTFRLDGDSNGQNYETVLVEIYGPAASIYGLQQSNVIQSRGLKSGVGGVRIAELTIANYFRRWGYKPLTVQVQCFTPAMVLELSDKVDLNHRLLPARAKGLYEIIEKQVNLSTGVTTLTLLNINWQTNTAYEVAVDGTPSWPGPNSNTNMYLSNASGQYGDGSAGRLIY